jgi:hypothetical protein
MGLKIVLVCDKKAWSSGWIGVPHLLQNWESSDMSAWHFGHFMSASPLPNTAKGYQLMMIESIRRIQGTARITG